ncbi:hypothetical protein ACJDT4_13895 [Clostridium neuense]|uniref:PKD domain-containing protein n=1 Tax=Clostridium neuense TaxID=1728934 RepID=A0ABW8TG62_9CLOT
MKRLILSKKVLAICLSLFIAAGGITGFALHVNASKDNGGKDTTVDNTAPTASFGLSKKKKADIVFTTGSDNNFNSDDFNNKVNAYVKNRLVNSGVDTNIQSFSTSTISTANSNASDIFNKWQNYPDSSGSWTYNSNDNTMGSTANVSWTGYWDSSSEAQKTTDVTIDYDENEVLRNTDIGTLEYPNIRCHPDPMGFTFRMTNTNGVYSYYAFEIYSYQGVAMLYRVNNVPNPNNADNGILVAWTNTTNPVVGLQGTYSKCLGFQHIDYNPLATHHVKINAKGRHITIQYDSNNVFDVTDNDSNALINGSYGPYTYSMPNACFKNITITKGSSKSLSEALKEPTWRDNTHKFVVNLSEDALKSIVSSSKDYPTTLSTMLSNKEYFLGVMNTADESTVNSFIDQNDGHGTYINNNNIDTALNAVTDYILKILNEEQDNSNIFLVGDEVTYNETYKDNEGDKKNDELWKYEQDPKHLNYDDDFVKCSESGDLPLDNDLGAADFATGQWVHNKVTVFDKPGKYKISYKVQDNPTATDSNPSGDSNFNNYNKWSPDDNSIIINVHRKPTPVFTAYAVANASTGKFDVTVKDEDKSYDIDHQTTDGTRKGIVNKKFQWKEVTSGVTDTWHDGKLPSPQSPNKDFLVKLSVQDLEGQWSDDLVKYVTTKNENLPPVAQFTENETEMPVDQLKNDVSTGKDVVFTDQSYDPNGDSIRETWTVKDSSGNVLYNSSTMPTASVFIGKPLGTYTITLVCDDGPTPKVGVPLTSDPYTLQLKLVPINHKPVAHFEVDNTSKEPDKIKITEDSTDPDGDPIDDRIWTITDSSGNVVGQSENKLPDLSTLDGTYTLTLKVKDNPKIPPELWSNPYSQQITVESLKLTGTLYPSPAKQGQQVTFDLNTIGYAKYLRIYLPNDIISRDTRGTTLPIVKTITEEYTHNEKINYILPINTPLTLDGNGNRIRPPYEIPVQAEKANGAQKSITLYLDVKGNVLDGIKTEIIGTGQDRDK